MRRVGDLGGGRARRARRVGALARRVRRSPGARLRSAARRELARHGLGDLVLTEVVVDQRHRSVCRARRSDGTAVYLKADARPGRTAREAAGLRGAAGVGVPVPRVLHESTERIGVLVLEAIRGSPLLDAGPDAWKSAGAVLRRLHSSAPPPWADVDRGAGAALGWLERCRRDVAVAARELVARGQLGEADAAAVAQRIERGLGAAAPPSPQFLHGDCMAKHLLVDGAEVRGIIDWADACGGDPLWDLAVVSQFAPERLADLLEGYEADDHERERAAVALPAYWDLRHLRAAVWTADHGLDPTFHLDALRATG